MELILEIGTEEIPSGYIKNGLDQLKALSEEMFKKNRIACDEIGTYGTPRRLVLIARGISEKQEDTIQEIKGPPKNVSFDKQGNPTKAAISFAQKNNAKIEDIEIISTPKGEYLFIRHKIPGQMTFDILKEELPKVISGISWPKSMRWADVRFSFARPIHWILCLLDGKVVPIEIAGIKAGNTSRGHRFMAPDPMVIRGVEDHLEQMRKAYVIIDPEERKRMVMESVKKSAEEIKGIPDDDSGLLDTVTNLVEYPFAICGGFEERFLELPAPVIITPMKEHQKYFPVYTRDKKLMPNFVAISNIIPKDVDLVKKGLERVIRARLSDAEFFFKEDQKRPLMERLEELKDVIYHARLGTSMEKVERFTKLAEYICGTILPEALDDVRLVCKLCKCDLTTLMVSEFPDLQGIMGREYARIEGYPKHICNAIYEHYLPAGSFGDLPGSDIGAIVGVADRMDTVCGYFAIGIKPTGSADPFGLRRHAISIIRIIEGMGWDISIRDIIKRSLEILSSKVEIRPDIEKEILSFFKDRYRFMIMRDGYPAEIVNAIISVSFDKISPLRERIRQLQEYIQKTDNFEELVLTVKRISNILKKQEERYQVDESLFNEIWEERLWKSYLEIERKVKGFLSKGDYFHALETLSLLKTPVDELFDNVEILTKKDEKLKRNRIALIQGIEMLFKEVADFSKFSY
ncbi:MAG: glycine--tRNA ligase subunit beta [Deltaproteobacteria bacterium]|nr:MAG: glycine--tRNA ligase subunit beta [Deltaproteobacteria bacterium]